MLINIPFMKVYLCRLGGCLENCSQVLVLKGLKRRKFDLEVKIDDYFLHRYELNYEIMKDEIVTILSDLPNAS